MPKAPSAAKKSLARARKAITPQMRAKVRMPENASKPTVYFETNEDYIRLLAKLPHQEYFWMGVENIDKAFETGPPVNHQFAVFGSIVEQMDRAGAAGAVVRKNK